MWQLELASLCVYIANALSLANVSLRAESVPLLCARCRLRMYISPHKYYMRRVRDEFGMAREKFSTNSKEYMNFNRRACGVCLFNESI